MGRRSDTCHVLHHSALQACANNIHSTTADERLPASLDFGSYLLDDALCFRPHVSVA